VPVLLKDGPWDVLVIDAEAAADTAVALTRLVRQSFSATELPILFVGTQATLDTRNEALAAGANDWTAHPLDPAEMTRRAANLAALSRLRRAHRSVESEFEREIAGRTARLDALIESGLMMSMERDRSRLLRHILDEGQKLLNCDCATMYLVDDDKTLRFELRTRSDDLPSTRIPMYDAQTGRPNENYISVYTALHNRSVVIDDVYGDTGFDLTGTRAFDQASGYRTVSMLTVPMAPRGGDVIGVLQFINAMDRQTGRIVPFAEDMVGLVEALAAQSAIALDNLNLVESQKQLMESLIRVLATAIDAKSPYTGRHCERVPELAFLLADAACRTSEGPLADFSFRNEDEWQEFRIGAWLHDCGKVTTPEYVIDKATKLETIQNRIHEVRMRFEVLLRDLEIERLQALARGEPASTVDARFQKRRAQLFDDFAFVAECNIGTEAMEASHIERLERISEATWTRHFDDRLGLSQGELDRRAAEPPTGLPAVERLLADRPRDLVPRTAEQEPDPAFHFRIDVPEHLYNHGELYNLRVRSGTLTPEERYKINEHMVHTVMMLERMPFPKNLRRVPEYAGTHHERMDGRGYPRRLGAADLSVPSRIMAVADIFEALTASDRPYKKPKKLSEALRVLRGMAGDHVDPDIFNLFISSGVFLQYANKHLAADQIDVVDGTPYLAPIGG
jgi:HD-GYP domain-containing protein (c-di-GMP phosphodiesterase class II)